VRSGSNAPRHSSSSLAQCISARVDSACGNLHLRPSLYLLRLVVLEAAISYEIEHRLFRLAAWSIVAALLSALPLVLAGSGEHEWIAAQECFSRRASVGEPFLLRRNSVEYGSFRLGLIVAAFALGR